MREPSRAPAPKKRRRVPPSGAAAQIVAARLGAHVTLEAHGDGRIAACFYGHSVDLGTYDARVAAHAQALRTGLPLEPFAAGGSHADGDILRLVQRLARHGLVEYRLANAPDGDDVVVVEPQVADYWPQLPQLDDAQVLVLSRFAYLRRRGDALVLESPRAGALFKICDANIAAALAQLAQPQRIADLRAQESPGDALLALLVDSQILFQIAGDGDLRMLEGGDDLALWDFHDLLFHARSTEGRHANPSGGLYPCAGIIPPLPAVRPAWPGKAIPLEAAAGSAPKASSPLAQLVRDRHSVRSFDEEKPITLAELAQFLDRTTRVLSRWESRIDFGDGDGPTCEYAARPYPAAGAEYELELYLAVHQCDGLARGFYHYDSGTHALTAIEVRSRELEALLTSAEYAMGAPAAPQILITLAARFGRIAWKYSSIAYSLILKDVGVLLQTFYLTATDLGLGGCAIGTGNIDLFAKMTGLDIHIEGPVGQFALGREAKALGES